MFSKDTYLKPQNCSVICAFVNNNREIYCIVIKIKYISLHGKMMTYIISLI